MIKKVSHFLKEDSKQYNPAELNKALILYIVDEFNKQSRDLDGKDINPEEDITFFDDHILNNGFINTEISSQRLYTGPINDLLKDQIQKTEEGLQALKIFQQITDYIYTEFDLDFQIVIDSYSNSKEEAKIWINNQALFLINNPKLVHFLESKKAINKFKL